MFIFNAESKGGRFPVHALQEFAPIAQNRNCILLYQSERFTAPASLAVRNVGVYLHWHLQFEAGGKRSL